MSTIRAALLGLALAPLTALIIGAVASFTLPPL
jgi:hypothetical protein